jgi:hypothetical protein
MVTGYALSTFHCCASCTERREERGERREERREEKHRSVAAQVQRRVMGEKNGNCESR